MEDQDSLSFFLPALLMLFVCLLSLWSVKAHIPFLSLGIFSPKKAALLGDLAWPGEGKGMEGGRAKERGGQRN